MSTQAELLSLTPEPLKRGRYDLIRNPLFESTRFRDILVTRHRDLIEEATAVCPIDFGMLDKQRPTCLVKHGYHLLSA